MDLAKKYKEVMSSAIKAGLRPGTSEHQNYVQETLRKINKQSLSKKIRSI